AARIRVTCILTSTGESPMKNKIKLAIYVAVTMFLLSLGLTNTALTNEGNSRPSLNRPVKTPAGKREKELRIPAQDRQTVSSERLDAGQSATVNFAEAALKEALTPTATQEARFVPEPEEEEEGAGERPIPPGAHIFSETSAVPAPPQPLVPSPVVTA